MTALLQQQVFTHVLSLCWDGPRYLSQIGTDHFYLNTAAPTLGISLNMSSRAASQVARRPSQFQFWWFGASLVAQPVTNLPAMQETRVWSLGLEDHEEESTAAQSSILAWRIPWTEEPGGYGPWVTKSRTWPKQLSTYARMKRFKVRFSPTHLKELSDRLGNWSKGREQRHATFPGPADHGPRACVGQGRALESGTLEFQLQQSLPVQTLERRSASA